MEWHSIDAVATVKKTQEHFDRLHIYEVNDKKMNGQPSYVFKSSTPKAKMALLMDQDHPQKTPFQDVVVFMDSLHSHSHYGFTILLFDTCRGLPTWIVKVKMYTTFPNFLAW